MCVESLKVLGRRAVSVYLRTRFRGRSRLLHQVAPCLAPRGNVELVRIGDYVLPLDHSERATRMMAYGVYEADDLRFAETRIQEGDVVLDVGANVGYCAARFAKMVGPSGSVYAFEPSRTCLRNLYSLVDSNPSGPISVVPQGVAESSRSSTYFETGRTISHGYGRLDHRPSQRHTVTDESTVQVTSLDDFCRLSQIDQVDFIKIDVEGAEYAVLRGFGEMFRSGLRPNLMIEMSGGSKERDNRIKIIKLLRALRYTPRLASCDKLLDVENLAESSHLNVFWTCESNA